MKAGKPLLVRAPSSDDVVCYGTVFVAQSDNDWVNVDKQVASTDHCASTAVHIYACSVPFRDVLAALTEEQEDPVAPEW